MLGWHGTVMPTGDARKALVRHGGSVLGIHTSALNPGPSTQISRRVGVCGQDPGCAVSALQSQPAGGWTSWG
jgi:hypothetical protein